MTETSITTAALTQERRVVTAVPGPLSRAMHERRLLAVGAGVGASHPIYVTRGGGGILADVDGNQFIDFSAGIGVVGVGNAAPRVVDAVSQQARDFTHTAFTVAPYEEYVAVCEQLNRLTPGSHAKRSALFNSGSEAVENAVKVARLATGRAAIVVLEHAYHGRTNLTLAMTAKASPFKTGFGPFAPEVYRIPASYPLRDGRSGAEAVAEAVTSIRSRIGADQVAAIVCEPVIGEGGFLVPAPGFLSGLLDFARDNGIVFIADEVQSGFGRTGNWFASEHEGIVPDIVVIGKGVGGGLPLSAITARAELMDAVHPGGLGGTYAGSPVACAAALAAIETMEQDNLLEAARRIGEVSISALQAAAGLPGSPIAEVRGRGAMLAIELVKTGSLEPDADLATRVARSCFQQGVVVLVTGTYGNVIRLLPPLVIPEDLLIEGLGILISTIADESQGAR